MKRFLLIALCATQVSFGMQPDQNDLKLELSRAIVMRGDVDLEKIKQLLATGVDPSQWIKVGCEYYFGVGSELLFRAIERGFFEACQALIDAGADVNLATQINRYTPLMIVSPGNGKICRLLLDAGANVHAVSRCGKTPLMYACEGTYHANEGSLEVCELLLQYGADHKSGDNEGKRAIDHARESLRLYPRSEIIALLEDPEKIRAVIMRADNPNIGRWRKTDPNICNALMNRELGRK